MSPRQINPTPSNLPAAKASAEQKVDHTEIVLDFPPATPEVNTAVASTAVAFNYVQAKNEADAAQAKEERALAFSVGQIQFEAESRVSKLRDAALAAASLQHAELEAKRVANTTSLYQEAFTELLKLAGTWVKTRDYVGARALLDAVADYEKNCATAGGTLGSHMLTCVFGVLRFGEDFALSCSDWLGDFGGLSPYYEGNNNGLGLQSYTPQALEEQSQECLNRLWSSVGAWCGRRVNIRALVETGESEPDPRRKNPVFTVAKARDSFKAFVEGGCAPGKRKPACETYGTSQYAAKYGSDEAEPKPVAPRLTDSNGAQAAWAEHRAKLGIRELRT